MTMHATNAHRKIERFIAKISVMMSIFHLAGCKTYESYGTSHGYQAYEEGKLRQFNVVFIHINSTFVPATIHSMDLVPIENAWSNNSELADIDQRTPPCRRLTPSFAPGEPPHLLEAVDAITKDEVKGRIRWILGTNPVVVGIGTDVEDAWSSTDPEAGPKVLLLQNADHLVNAMAMDRMVETIYISHPWSTPATTVIKIPIATKLSIAELLRTRPWEHNIKTKKLDE